MELACDLPRIVARKHEAQGIGCACRMTCREQARDRRLLASDFVLERTPARVERRRRTAYRRRLVIERRECAVDLRDGSFRFAQRVARLPSRGFLFFERGGEGGDPFAQIGEIARLCRTLCLRPLLGWRRADLADAVYRRDEQRGKQRERGARAPQAFALPCAETAAMRCATSSAFPR